MLERQITKTVDQLKRTLGEDALFRLGRRSGFEKRERSITTMRFVGSLLHSLGTRRVESIADLLRDFNYDHDEAIYYKPYYNRLDCPGFPELMRQLFETMMSTLSAQVLRPAKDAPLQRFQDVILHDGTSFGLHDDLAAAFPGRFTKVRPAAVELHTTVSLFYDNFTCVTVAPDAESERHFTPEPSELRGKLFLADRNFDGIPFVRSIAREGGHFIIRLRANLNPEVVKIDRNGSRYRALEGRRLSEVIKRLPKGKTHDIDIRCKDGWCVRIALKWAGTERGWMRLITNLERSDFATAEVLQAYRLRWQVELFYKELKSYANLHIFCTRKRHIAEGLIWAALCAAFLKRYMAHACQRVSCEAISTRRVSMCSHTFLKDLFRSLRGGFRNLRSLLERTFQFLSVNAPRSNLKRERRKGRLASPLDLIGLRSHRKQAIA
jgi:Transposase DDE domain